MTGNPFSQRQSESSEIPTGKIESGIDTLQKAVDQMPKIDINLSHTTAMANVDVMKPMPEDVDGLTFMQAELMSVLGKIAKKYPKLELAKISGGNLPELAKKSHIPISSSESIALTKLSEIKRNSASPLARELEMVWPEMIKDVEEKRQWDEKTVLEKIKEKPETLLTYAAIAGGIFLGIKLLSWIAGKGVKKAKAKVGKFFSTGNVLAMLGLSAFGAFKGKDWLADILGFTDEKEKIKGWIDKLKKTSDPEERKKLYKKIEELSKKLKNVPGKVIEGGKKGIDFTKRSKEVGLAWAMAERHMGREITPEEKIVCENHSETIKSLNKDLDVKPALFAIIGHEKYEDYIKHAPSLSKFLFEGGRLALGRTKRTKKAFSALGINYGGIELAEFLDSNLLKNKDDFKELTILEVMEKVENNPDRYIDKEAVAKTNEVNEHTDKVLQMAEEAENNPKKLEDTKFLGEWIAHMVIAGITFTASKLWNGGVYILKNGYPILRWESKIVYNAITSAAEEVDKYSSVLGGYLYCGAYTAAIGAPIGTVMGPIRTFMKTGMVNYSLLRGGIGGTLSGAKKGLFLPGRVVWALTGKGLYGKITKGVGPIQNVQAIMDEQRFILEDLSLSRAGSKWFGMRTLTEKMLAGEVKINERLVRRLVTYKDALDTHIAQMTKLARSKKGKMMIFNQRKERYVRMKDEIDSILKLVSEQDAVGKLKLIGQARWAEKMNGLGETLKLDKETLDILTKEKNFRLGIILSDKAHPIAKMLKMEQYQNGAILRLMDGNETVLNALTRNRGLINDHHILAKLEKMDPDLADVIVKRAEVWKSFSRNEKYILDMYPDVASRYTKLIDYIKNAGEKGSIEYRLLKKILMSSKSRRAQFVYNHINDLDVLFDATNKNHRAALNQFLEMNEGIFKRMEKASAKGKAKPFTELAEYFRNFGKNEKNIKELASSYQTALGRMTRNLRSTKAGWRGTGFSEAAIEGLAKEKNASKIVALFAKKGLQIDPEITELIINARNTNDIKAVIEMVAEENAATRETASIISHADDSLKAAKADLAKVEKTVQEAQRNLEQAQKTNKGISEARQILDKTEEAERRLKNLSNELESLQTTKKALEGVEEGSKEAAQLAKQLEQSEKASEEALMTAIKATEETGQISRLGKIWGKVKWGGKWLGRAGAVAGAGYSFWEAGSSAYEAFTTDIEGRAGIEAANAAMWGVNGAVDTAFVVSLFSKGGPWLTKWTGRVWAPLATAVYIGDKVFKTMKEETATTGEWAQSCPYDQLIHEWFTTHGHVSVGDAYITLLGIETVDESLEAKKKNMHKIFQALIAAQNENLDVLKALGEQKSRHEIDELIAKNFTKYHEYYFQEGRMSQLQNYQAAQRFIVEAETFNKIMQKRDELKREGVKEFRIGAYNLMEDRYDVREGTPQVDRYFSPQDVIAEYQKQIMLPIEKTPQLKKNLEAMETSYLMRLYIQAGRILKEWEGGKWEMDQETIGKIKGNMSLIRVYLTTQRKVIFNIAILKNQQFAEPPMNPEELLSCLEDFSVKNASRHQEFAEQHFDRKPGVRALYRLAEYFGYSGLQREEDLKIFFSEDRANYQGIYWDGSEWHVQEAGDEVDEDMGTELNYKTVSKMVNELVQNPNNILESRHESWFVSSEYTFNFGHQVRAMAEILQGGYNEGVDLYTKEGAKIGFVAPQSFESNEPKGTENYELEYGNEIGRIKKEANWSQLDYHVIDQNTIELARLDTDQKTKITRSGDRWQIENYADGLSFDQAVAMGNLLNYTKKIVTENKWEGGEIRPFEIDGKDIDFDKAGTPFDTTFIDGDLRGGWLDFMERIGINRQDIVDTLNEWYANEYHYTTA
ncbi:hypothetical protein KKA33_03190 [Patescibacteria group bacterium]|nr:hypothetical protein [Patescibacteria group bacterium]